MKTKLIELSDRVRIESGPRKFTEVATEELLDDKITARHYKVGAFDAGSPPQRIQLGKKHTFVDWRSPLQVWNVYEHDGERFQKKGTYDTEAEAVKAAAGLIGG